MFPQLCYLSISPSKNWMMGLKPPNQPPLPKHTQKKVDIPFIHYHLINNVSIKIQNLDCTNALPNYHKLLKPLPIPAKMQK